MIEGIYMHNQSLFYSNQPKGGWSSEGIIQDSDPILPVFCKSTHLTSFAVLVSAESGENFQVVIAMHLYILMHKLHIICIYSKC